MYALDKAKAKWRGFLFDSKVRSDFFGSVSEKIGSKNKSSQGSTFNLVREIEEYVMKIVKKQSTTTYLCFQNRKSQK